MAHRSDPAPVDFSRVYASYAGNRKFMEEAWDEFCYLTDLDEGSIETEEDRLFIHSVFSEWVLFDYDIHRGKTPLEKFVTWPPADCGSNLLSSFAQAAVTNFTSTFHVLDYDAVTHRLSLENVADGVVYRVYDERVARDLGIEPGTGPRGLICCRVMRVRGKWLLSGNVLSYDDEEPSAAELAAMRDDEGEHGDLFCEMVRAIYGRTPLSAADTVAHGFSSLSHEERGERLASAREEYAALQRGLELEVGWDDLARMIREEDGEGTALTLMDSIVGQERVDAMGEEELVHTLKPIMAAWNLLPHDILNGLTPVEDYEARYPAASWEEEAEADAVPATAAEDGRAGA